jgi:hypothetical protein
VVETCLCLLRRVIIARYSKGRHWYITRARGVIIRFHSRCKCRCSVLKYRVPRDKGLRSSVLTFKLPKLIVFKDKVPRFRILKLKPLNFKTPRCGTLRRRTFIYNGKGK